MTEPWQVKRTEEIVGLLRDGKITNGEVLVCGLLLDIVALLEKLREAGAMTRAGDPDPERSAEMSTLRLPNGYEIDLDKIPTVRDVIAINAQVGWIPETQDEMALQAWARSLMAGAERQPTRAAAPPVNETE